MGVYLVERVAVKSWVDPVQLLFEDVVQSHEQRVHRRQTRLLVGAHVGCRQERSVNVSFKTYM